MYPIRDRILCPLSPNKNQIRKTACQFYFDPKFRESFCNFPFPKTKRIRSKRVPICNPRFELDLTTSQRIFPNEYKNLQIT